MLSRTFAFPVSCLTASPGSPGGLDSIAAPWIRCSPSALAACRPPNRIDFAPHLLQASPTNIKQLLQNRSVSFTGTSKWHAKTIFRRDHETAEMHVNNVFRTPH
jgi:hypothetical protein